MTSTHTLTIRIEASSQVSEADLHDYTSLVAADISSYCRTMKYDEWRQKIYTNYEESYPVELNVEVK